MRNEQANSLPTGCGNLKTQAIPMFADRETICQLFGVPNGTLRMLAREMKVACHKLGNERQAKTVYFCEDVINWVKNQSAPDWVLNCR